MTDTDRRSSDTPAQPIPTVGRYEVVRLLGRGAMGAVLLAHDPILDRDIALKVMLPQIGADADQRLRLEREARAVARMTHPNVVTVFDLGYLPDGSPYIAMELLRGQDLLQALDSGRPFTPEQKLSVILQVLDGVGHAHRAGIVHRDIKPANTFLTEDGPVKIMDFGVAHYSAASITSTGVVVGTANYMAPEQVSGGRVDGRADLFSVGCMLYELAYGRRPFQADTVMTTLWKIVQEEPSYDSPPPGLPGITPVLRRALAKKPDQRYQTAEDFAAALRALLGEAGKPVAPSPAAAGAPAATPFPAASRPEPGPSAPPRAGASPAPPLPFPDPTPLFALMRDVQTRARSGQLYFHHGSEFRSLRIRRGAIVHGTSDVAGQHLGDILVRYGFLTQVDLERATALALGSRRRLGHLLAEKGLVTPERVHEAVGIHVREILTEVTGRSDGTFAFEELADDGSVADEPATFAMGQMILETARRIQSPDLVRRVLGAPDRTVSLSTHPLLRSQALSFTPTEGFLLSRIDGTTTAGEALALVPLPIEDVERSLFALLCTGTVEYVPEAQPSARSRGAAAGRPAPARRDAPAPPDKFREAARGLEQRAASIREAIEARQAGESRRREILSAHDGIGRSHFEVLGLDPGCSTGEVEAAFRRLAISFHPDAPLDPSLGDLRGKRAQVYRRLLEAYEVLRDLDRRSEYKASLAPRPAEPATAAEAPGAHLPMAQVVSLHTGGPLDPAIIFEGIREAHQLIRDEKTWDAIQLLQSLIAKAEGHNRFRAQVLLARAYLRNPRWTKRAEDLLHQVVREAPEHAEAYVVLGNIYRAGDLRTRAIAMYRRALSLQPAHPEAAEGLEALEPTPEEPMRGTLFRKLLGKTPKEP